ncbi:MAG: 50S ribosomal protein L11 methyltransferase [Deltaproteobacteria bacterium]|nr:50S ribosomal protein L11 methyltransferase [Deltaproteobacteria bacterium]
MKEKWIEVLVRVPEVLAEIVENQLTELGSTGSVEDTLGEKGDPVPAKPLIKGYFYGTDETTLVQVKAFKGFIASLGNIFPSSEIEEVQVRETSEDEWQEWRRFFKPTLVSDRIVIKPTWEAYEKADNQLIVEIDPGMAFGTGSHESTRMCIRLLDEVIKGGESVFDVGTGSGILAIAAAKLGAASVFGIDNHDDSVRVAGENIGLNHVENIVTVSTIALEDVEETYNIVVANILAEDLIDMCCSLVGRTREGGRIILSGILTTKARMVIDAYEGEGVKLEKQLEEGDWSALMFRK